MRVIASTLRSSVVRYFKEIVVNLHIDIYSFIYRSNYLFKYVLVIYNSTLGGQVEFIFNSSEFNIVSRKVEKYLLFDIREAFSLLNFDSHLINLVHALASYQEVAGSTPAEAPNF